MVTQKKSNKKEEPKYYVVFYDEEQLLEQLDVCKSLDEALVNANEAFCGNEVYVAELLLVNKKKYIQKFVESK